MFDAPSRAQVFEDISTMLTLVKNEYPSASVYLVGHSSGAGLLLNYSMYAHKRNDLYSGYILLAPYLGPRTGIERLRTPGFVKKTRVWIYVLNQLFKLPLFQHIPAVFFNWPSKLLKQDPLIVASYSYTMSCATTPHKPHIIFEQLDKPCTLYVGQEDELFIPEKLVEFSRYNSKGIMNAEIIPQTKHLSILLCAPQLIAKAIKIR